MVPISDLFNCRILQFSQLNVFVRIGRMKLDQLLYELGISFFAAAEFKSKSLTKRD